MNYYSRFAAKLVDNGFSVVTVLPGTKKPRFRDWQAACFLDTDVGFVDRMSAKYPGDSVGIATGNKITAIDIDSLDDSTAWELHELAFTELGETRLIRVGQWPKRVLVYRAADAVDSIKAGHYEVLGKGRQFVAFGTHPDTRRPYYWPDESPAETQLDQLPEIGATHIARFLRGAASLAASAAAGKLRFVMPANDNTPTPQKPLSRSRHGSRVKRDINGLICDGREEYLRDLTYEIFRQGCRTVDELAQRVWTRFTSTADLARPKGGQGHRRWLFRDARTKAKAIWKNRSRIPTRRFRNQSAHLHSYRRLGYWTDVAKAAHQEQARYLALAPAALITNQTMLEFVPVETGQCLATINQLRERTGFSRSAVTNARKELLRTGLWIAERGVYVPIRPRMLEVAATPEKKAA